MQMPHDELWEAFRKGSQAAFSSIYRRYAPLLFNYGSRICVDKALVEDSIQDLFVDLWNRRKRIVCARSVKSYLFKALRYKIYRNLGRIDGRESLDKYIPQLMLPSYEELCIDLETKSLQIKRLRDAVEKLPARQREAINLRYIHRFSNEEIADIMSINYHSACKVIYAGLRNLAESLKVSVIRMLIFCMLLPPGYLQDLS